MPQLPLGLQVDLEMELDHLEEVMGQAMDSLLAKFPPEETAHLAWRQRQPPQQQQQLQEEIGQGELGPGTPAGEGPPNAGARPDAAGELE
jgi:hypothetical protein